MLADSTLMRSDRVNVWRCPHCEQPSMRKNARSSSPTVGALACKGTSVPPPHYGQSRVRRNAPVPGPPPKHLSFGVATAVVPLPGVVGPPPPLHLA